MLEFAKNTKAKNLIQRGWYLSEKYSQVDSLAIFEIDGYKALMQMTVLFIKNNVIL